MTSVDGAVQQTRNQARRAAANPWLRFAQRLGYVVRGLLYGVMGALALGVALGLGGPATGPEGSLAFLVDNPARTPLLIVFGLGLAAYAVWGLVRAILDPFHRGSEPVGIAERLGFAWSGLTYGVLAVVVGQLLAWGGRARPEADGTHVIVAATLAWPGGGWITGAAGMIALLMGLSQFIEAYRAGFRKYLKRERMDRVERAAADWLGRWGMLARGVTFSVLGFLLMQAGLHHDAERASGFGGAFVFILAQPLGRPLTVLVALGFIALGLHSLAQARWMRLLGD